MAFPPNRQRLPDRRSAVTFNFEHFGLRYTCSFGRYANGKLAELFVGNHKSGSGADCNVRDAAIAVSLALQHGADPDVLRRGLSRDSRGRALSPIGAALDLIAGAS
jgi:hypothetical protein